MNSREQRGDSEIEEQEAENREVELTDRAKAASSRQNREGLRGSSNPCEDICREMSTKLDSSH